MTQPLTYLLQLHQLAQQHRTRFGCWLRGEPQWQNALLNSLINHFTDQSIFMLGNSEINGVTCVDYHQGQQWLGKECQLLICDLGQGWDADSFNAALGTLVGGGLLIVTGEPHWLNPAARHWLETALAELIVIGSQESPAL
ncbi:MAG: tRNA(Met) cytidine acetyltransferase, partial [Vibrio sp.]